ncbi:acyl carrier protein [Actinomadura graeca]|uniref:Acyl carrier protein n=1 Tax=Actinomadura graeca TaxID=2750812 RepID=A0ABX8QS11_9ACTN|nr:acyl carrier protein [Actinomadura graeca]QXJ21423.1 acyl carrier protein [Actinomadura graeca]
MIRKKLRNKIPAGAELDQDTELEGLGLSSLQIADVVFALEDRFEFEFELERALAMKTVGDIVTVANQALSEHQA